MSSKFPCEPANPIAASFPTGKGFHVKVDLATSRVARGNIIAAQKRELARLQQALESGEIGSAQ